MRKHAGKRLLALLLVLVLVGGAVPLSGLVVMAQDLPSTTQAEILAIADAMEENASAPAAEEPEQAESPKAAVQAEAIVPQATSTEGVLTYELSGTSVTITDCNVSATNAQVASALSALVSAGYKVEIIGSYAFENCSYLSSVTFPATLKTINSGAFWYTALTSVTLPSSLTTCDYAYANGQYRGPFAFIPTLKTVTFASGTTNRSCCLCVVLPDPL